MDEAARTKINDLYICFPFLFDQDVFWFQVAVDQVEAMNEVQAY
jgi:hypothetical protein